MQMRQLFDPDTWTYTYLLFNEAGQAVLIDPVVDHVDRDLNLIMELGLTLHYALDTHVHADHVTGSGVLRERTGCKTVASAGGPESASVRLRGDEKLKVGDMLIQGIATPGHTDDSISYLVEGNLFSGDAILVRGCGRCDFQNGDAETLYDSITKRIFTLPDETKIWPGHDYHGYTVTSVAEEKRFNPRLAGKTREEFVRIMEKLDLPMPAHIQQAVPANVELGLGIDPGTNTGFDECSGDEAWTHRQAFRVIDVREPHEFSGELGHMPGAESIPMGAFPDVAEHWDRDDPLLVVCRSGRRSRQICSTLADLGFGAVTNLRGGMIDYRERGHEVA